MLGELVMLIRILRGSFEESGMLVRGEGNG